MDPSFYWQDVVVSLLLLISIFNAVFLGGITIIQRAPNYILLLMPNEINSVQFDGVSSVNISNTTISVVLV